LRTKHANYVIYPKPDADISRGDDQLKYLDVSRERAKFLFPKYDERKLLMDAIKKRANKPDNPLFA